MSDNLNRKLNILHLLSSSLPKVSGYAIRSHNILRSQKNYVNPYGLTAPRSFHNNKIDIIDGIKYYRYPYNPGIRLFVEPKISKKLRIDKAYDYYYRTLFKCPLKFLRKVVDHLGINIIHGHSTEKFAKFGDIIAKERKIPFIYEVRGFLEDTHVGLGTIKFGSREYQKRKLKETLLMKKADMIITLGEAMRNDIAKRGILKRKIIVVPNGVNTEILKPKLPNMLLKKELGIVKKRVIGYIGSVRRIEGIEYLLRAISILKKRKEDVFLLIVGSYDPIYFSELNLIIKKLGITNSVKFTGLVPNSVISDYYSIIDIIVIPRKNLRVNRLVTPLKPLEAMALERIVLTSDLPALREMVKPNISGDIFEAENTLDLVDKIFKYLNDPLARNRLGKLAREYVLNNYDWNNLAEKYVLLYSNLLGKNF